MSKFWDTASCSLMAGIILLGAILLVSLSGCDVRATPSTMADEIFCVQEDPETGTGRTYCCREYATDPTLDCWHE